MLRGTSIIKRRAERDRVLRRGDDSEPPTAIDGGRAGEVQERHDRAEVVEDVVVRPRLDDRRYGDSGSPARQCAYDDVQVAPIADHGRDQVVDDEERREEEEALRDVGGKAGHSTRIREQREHDADQKEEDRGIERRLAKPHAGIDEQRRHPGEEDEADDEAVGLELEGQARGQDVPLDRDEEDDEDDQRDLRAPWQERPIGRRADYDEGENGSDFFQVGS